MNLKIFLTVITNNYEDKMIPLYPVIGNHELMFGEKVDTFIKDLREKIDAINKPGEPAPSHTKLFEGNRTIAR